MRSIRRMRRGDYTWGKFVCPVCKRKFREKVRFGYDIVRGVIDFEPSAGGGTGYVVYECHTHCPDCGKYIPWRDRK